MGKRGPMGRSPMRNAVPFEGTTPWDERWNKVELGKRSDADIAAEEDVEVYIVVRERTKRKIPAFHEAIAKANMAKRHVDWSQYPLGRKPDAEIVRLLAAQGIASNTGAVRAARMRLRIRPCAADKPLRGAKLASTHS